MTKGYVYVLMNPLIDGLVKIGRTTRSSEERAAEISRPTGVPGSFRVIYEELVSDCRSVERHLHEVFGPFRVESGKEFFRVPMKDVVRELVKAAAKCRPYSDLGTPPPADEEFEILPELRAKHGDNLRPGLLSVRMAHRNSVCFLQILSRPYESLEDEVLERVDLGLIVNEEDPVFSVDSPIKENARRFVEEMDDYSIIMCTPLFTEEACYEVDRRHRQAEFGSAGDACRPGQHS